MAVASPRSRKASGDSREPASITWNFAPGATATPVRFRKDELFIWNVPFETAIDPVVVETELDTRYVRAELAGAYTIETAPRKRPPKR